MKIRFWGIPVAILVLTLSGYNGFAAHIIGGEMYYECLGYAQNGQDSTKRIYRITIKLWRDCQAQNAAGFDNPVGFTVFRRQGTTYQIVRAPGGSQEFNVSLLNPIPTRIAPPNYPCLEIPPNVCVEEGTYMTDITLPIINEEYVIAWQRCCRNNTITNIYTPEATGATFTIEIHPEAQRTCNNSPQFKGFPPTIICVNNPIQFDHSAIDKEGDFIIYEFCEPLAGGGRGGGGGNCNSTTPTPECPPPFTPVAFKGPAYSYNFPLGGNPPVTINSINGMITGEPNDIGQFVVGVCVREYRNGILLSTLRRDFQFNVASCAGKVVADLAGATKVVGKKKYEFLVCNKLDFQFDNNSFQSNFIKDVLWTYQNGNKIDTSKMWEPQIAFKEGGEHIGQMVLNPGSNCSDTAYFKITLVPDLTADYKVSYDTCKSGPVTFKNLSSSTYSQISYYDWNLGDGIVSSKKDNQIAYSKAGKYPISLSIQDNYGCKQKKDLELSWFPAPEVAVFDPNVREGCVPVTVKFRNTSFPTDSTYKIIWKFSDGSIDSGLLVLHRFDSLGSFDLKMEITSPFGCYTEGNFQDVVTVFPPPTAKLYQDSFRLNINNPIVNLIDSTNNTIGRTWIIDNKDFLFDKEINYNLLTEGWHDIRMIASDRFLCTDTVDTRVFVYKDFTLFMPNAFSPNGDGSNEQFGPVGLIHSLQNYELKIYDRYGGEIFQSTNWEIGWNGKFQNSGADVIPGMYIYKLTYTLDNGKIYTETKALNLIR